MRLAFLLALPAAVALWVLATPMIATLYQYGKFTVNDVLQTRDALLGYSVGLLGLILVKILAPGFYARLDMKTPVKIAFATVLFAQTLALILMFRIGHAGLTLSTSLGACLNAGLLFWFLRRRGIYQPRSGLAAIHLEARDRAVRSRGRARVARGTLDVVAQRERCGRKSAASHGSARRARQPISARLWLLGFRLSDFDRREAEIDPAAAIDSGEAEV